MNKHKCGTCRFYQEARLASSGWCHHPQRKVSSDLMIMVRKNELACRDEWAHDLWESADAPRTAATPVGYGGQALDRRQPPATEQEIAAVIRAGAGPGEPAIAADQDDVVLSELGIPSPAPPAARPEPPRSPAPLGVEPATPPRVSDSGNRNSIIKAREAYRERSRLVAARSSEIARLAADAERLARTGEPTAPTPTPISTNPFGPADPRVDPWVAAPPPTSEPPFTKPSDRLDRELVESRDAEPPNEPSPQRKRAGLGAEANADPTSAATRAHPQDTKVARANQESTAEDQVHPRTQVDRDRTPTTAGTVTEPGAEQTEVPDLGIPESVPFATEEPAWSTEIAAASVAGHRLHDDLDLDTAREMRSDWPASTDVVYDNIGLDVLGIEAAKPDDDAIDDWLTGDVVADGDDSPPLAHTVIAAHLPRVCRNCRDFRPAENGERGWCGNQWAFSHRRMVDADEPTPCESSLGNWWLPVDEVWSDAADVSSHGQPTPLLDAWLLPPPEQVPARRRS